jgi:hypothetical protein
LSWVVQKGAIKPVLVTNLRKFICIVYEKEPTTPSVSCWQPASRLWQHAPSKQADGAPLADLMMLIPGLKHHPHLQLVHVQKALDSVVKTFGDKVVFADVNLKLNVVWVTVLPEPGLCREVALAIREHIPEAVMVGNHIKSISTELQVDRWWGWIHNIKRRLRKRLGKITAHADRDRKRIERRR